ncbi:MAG: SRPBCC family protein [Tranquillimonas sp.]
MKFSTRKDIALPQERVFAAVSDFPAFERQALRRGVEVVRADGTDTVGLGAAWTLRFDYRGRPREMEARVTGFDAPTGYTIAATTGGLELDLSVETMALARSRTRLFVSLDLRPQTVAARLLVQSLKLAKTNLARRFDRRVGEYAAGLETARP